MEKRYVHISRAGLARTVRDEPFFHVGIVRPKRQSRGVRMAGEVRTRTHDGLQSTVLETVALAAMRLPYIVPERTISPLLVEAIRSAEML